MCTFLGQISIVFIWPVYSCQSHQEGLSQAVYIHTERIVPPVHGLVAFYVNLSLLCYKVVQVNFDHLDIPQNIILVHSLNEVILIGMVSWKWLVLS